MHHFDTKQKLRDISRSKAFTLVEVIIVVAILGVVLQVVTSILLTIVRQQTAIIRFSDVKKEGDQILARMKTEIQTKTRNVYDSSLGTESCTNATPLTITTEHFRYGPIAADYFTFTDVTHPAPNASIHTVQFDSYGASTTSLTLSSPKVKITNFNLSCVKLGTYSNKLISIEFDIESSTPLMSSEGNPVIHYSTKVMLKN